MRFHHFLRVFIFVDYFYYSIVYSCNHTIKKRQFFFSCTRLTRNEHSAYVQSGYTTIEHFPWTSQISPNCCYFFWVCCVRRLILLRDAACHPRNSVECRTQICSIHHESSYSLREMIHCGTNSILCRYRCSGFCCVFMPFFFSNYYSNHRKEAEKKLIQVKFAFRVQEQEQQQIKRAADTKFCTQWIRSGTKKTNKNKMKREKNVEMCHWNVWHFLYPLGFST